MTAEQLFSCIFLLQQPCFRASCVSGGNTPSIEATRLESNRMGRMLDVQVFGENNNNNNKLSTKSEPKDFFSNFLLDCLLTGTKSILKNKTFNIIFFFGEKINYKRKSDQQDVINKIK